MAEQKTEPRKFMADLSASFRPKGLADHKLKAELQRMNQKINTLEMRIRHLTGRVRKLEGTSNEPNSESDPLRPELDSSQGVSGDN